MNAILDFIHVTGNVLGHFLRTAGPWIAAGVLTVLLTVRIAGRKSREERPEANYALEGLCLGMCFGAAIGTALGNSTGIGISLGTLAGLVIGMCIRKDQKDPAE